MSNADAWKTAERKSHYGHYPCLVWCDRAGEWHTARENAESIKAAMLAVGTQGKFYSICPRTGHKHILRWRLGTIMLRNARFAA